MKSHRALLIRLTGAVLFAATALLTLFALQHFWERRVVPVRTNSASAFDYEVRYTPEGFEPATLDVPLGARVAFIDTTEAPLWVASDPYLARTDYPGFDAGQSLGTSTAYVFRFEKSGTFGYHNEDSPSDHGTIHVVDPLHPVPDISKTKERLLAARDRLLKIFVPGNPDSIFTIVDAIEADPVLSLDCHDVAHDLGHRAYELYGFSGAMTYDNPARADHASVMDICAGGYVHGILEEASLHDPEFGNRPGALCDNVPRANQDTCYHGVGHALMFLTARDIPQSLSGCRLLKSAHAASRCFEGVWMETFWGDTGHAGEHSLGWSLVDPLRPCTDAAHDARPACLVYAPFGYLRAHPKDYAGAVLMCTQSDLSESDAAYCLKGVGIVLVPHFKAEELERTEPFADGLSAEEKHGFYEGVLGYGRLSGLSESDLAATCALLKNDAAVCLAALSDSR